MTVGISFTNGESLEAIVVTDSRVSNYQRKSDSVNKVREFRAKTFWGAVFGSGNGNYISDILRVVPEIQAKTLNEYVSIVQNHHKRRVDNGDSQHLHDKRGEIEKKARVLLDKSEVLSLVERASQLPEEIREDYIRRIEKQQLENYHRTVEQKTEQMFQEYDQLKAQPQNRTEFILVAYDENSERIRQFHISQQGTYEMFESHLEIGSGKDGAQMYLVTSLQGTNPNVSMKTEEKLFFAINAYNAADVNQGVGGTPSVLHVTTDDVKRFENDIVRPSANLSGAYMARFNEEKITTESTIEYLGRILEHDKQVYADLSEILDINESTLRGISIPYSSWQERANELRNRR